MKKLKYILECIYFRTSLALLFYFIETISFNEVKQQG